MMPPSRVPLSNQILKRLIIRWPAIRIARAVLLHRPDEHRLRAQHFGPAHRRRKKMRIAKRNIRHRNPRSDARPARPRFRHVDPLIRQRRPANSPEKIQPQRQKILELQRIAPPHAPPPSRAPPSAARSCSAAHTRRTPAPPAPRIHRSPCLPTGIPPPVPDARSHPAGPPFILARPVPSRRNSPHHQGHSRVRALTLHVASKMPPE